MSITPARSFTRLAAAIVIAAVVILAATLSYSATEATVTKTSTFTTTLSTAVTITETLNHTTTISVYSGGRLVGTCATNGYLVPDTVQSSSVVTMTSDGSTSSYTTYYPLSTTDYGGTQLHDHDLREHHGHVHHLQHNDVVLQPLCGRDRDRLYLRRVISTGEAQ